MQFWRDTKTDDIPKSQRNFAVLAIKGKESPFTAVFNFKNIASEVNESRGFDRFDFSTGEDLTDTKLHPPVAPVDRSSASARDASRAAHSRGNPDPGGFLFLNMVGTNFDESQPVPRCRRRIDVAVEEIIQDGIGIKKVRSLDALDSREDPRDPDPMTPASDQIIDQFIQGRAIVRTKMADAGPR